MNDLPEELFLNPVWQALHTRHRRFAIAAGEAIRYPAEVAPFAALGAPTEAALRDLTTLLVPDEHVWVIAEQLPEIEELHHEGTMLCPQMVLSENAVLPEQNHDIVSLGCASASEMVALTGLAYPGFFRERTCEMGEYFGFRSGGELVAMGGERIMLDGYSEISGICTHPSHRARGYAASLIGHLARKHREEGQISFLHVGVDNHRAIALYTRLGFRTVRTLTLHRLRLA